MTRKVLIILVGIALLAGCASSSKNYSAKTQLQIREYQTRMYDVDDTMMVMKAVFNVLQDDGYLVKNAVPELGLLSAEKQLDIENTGKKIMSILILRNYARWKKSSIIECTANISDFGDQTRVRINFQVRILNNKGNLVKVEQIDDQQFYQEFFAKVDKGIFIQKEKI
jgi:hypothetical protein